MDPRFQSSFIPKKPITAATARPSSSISLFVLLATIVFTIAIAAAGGVYFYQGYLQKQIDSAAASLDRAKAAFEPETINRIVRLDTRIETAKKLLSSHVYVTPLFDFLSSVTLKSVRFKDFSFGYLAPDKIGVSMKGQAASYSAVALQSDILNAQKRLSGTLLTDMALEAQGTVAFNLTTNIDPALLSNQQTR
ncbi:MAG TPA: hypothetical protein VFQ72_01515 [Candidatus Paceibacterota bacterium]|nr:hypothetical protein [Candidatus Paceibacterota bacterium]